MGFIKEKEGRIYLVLRDEPFFLSTLHHALWLSYFLELLDDYRNYDIDTFLVLTQRYLLVKGLCYVMCVKSGLLIL